MEFFFPADVFASFPGQARSGPSNPFAAHCGFGSQAPFEDFFADAIRKERLAEAARARAHAAQQAAEIRRARAARRAAELQEQKAAEERQFRAYFEHVLGLHSQHEEEARQRQAQREQLARQRQAAQQEYLAQLQRQREHQRRAQLQRQREQEEARRQQFAEYQRQKAQALQQERERIAAAQAARDSGKQFFLVLEDLLVGGLRALFDDDEPTEPTTTETPSAAPAAQPSTEESKDVKGKAKADDNVPEQHEVNTSPVATSTTVADSDPEELGPVPTTEATEQVAEAAKAVNESAEPVETAKEEAVLVFEHDFPTSGDFDKSSVQAGAIDVSVDEEKRTVTVSGLWNNEPAADVARASSPTPSSASGSQRGRSRSPKRARVSDVDENGNEIVAPEQHDTDEDFVEVHYHKSDSKPATTQKTFTLPEGAVINTLRAELTDQGLKLFTSKA